MDLTEQYYNKGHRLFVDKIYTSARLLVDLLSKGTYCAGTIKTNRTMFPKELIQETTMKLGSFHFASADKPKELLTMCWRDRRDVYVMSTTHNKSASTILKKPKGKKESVHNNDL